ncbi:hypothetical protein B0H11DRAFT_921606 [Mycena galericulata]|nr:hypothetical protein B0H11DRAFT_921606 [Mycena galericulata]
MHLTKHLRIHNLTTIISGRVTRTRQVIRLIICGEERHAKTDLCIFEHGRRFLLLVQEDKRQANPDPQLVAKAIAAFHSNNRKREQTLGLPLLPSKVIPGITTKGTAPTFFKVPVTEELVTALMGGVYPATETIVYVHLPPSPDPKNA